MTRNMNWWDLGKQVRFIRSLYNSYKIPLPPGGGLSRALNEADALAAGTKLPSNPSYNELIAIAHDAHVVWVLADGLRTCVDTGLDVKHHLAQIKTGTTDHGVPDEGSNRSIYCKDFECEVFIAAALIRKGLRPEFSTHPNDPRGDLPLDGVWIEVKHPNSKGQLEKLVKKFQKGLSTRDSYGVFAVGIEDALDLGDQTGFTDQVAYGEWLKRKQLAIESFGCGFLDFTSRRDKVLGAIQTATKVEVIGGASQLRRLTIADADMQRGSACVNGLRNQI